MKALLTRNWLDEKQSLGQLEVGRTKVYTLELPWKDNQFQVSCIPDGTYKVTKKTSRKFGKCFWIREVPNRTHILIHAGNYHWDILGCVLVGKDHKDINNDGFLDLIRSKAAMNEILAHNITEIEIITI